MPPSCKCMPPIALQHLWSGGGGGRWGGGRRAERGARQVEDDVVLVAADDADKVHPQGVEGAGILCCVKLVGNLQNAQLWGKNICGSKVFDSRDDQGEERLSPVCSRSGWGWKQNHGPWEKVGHSGRRPDCYLTSPLAQHPVVGKWEEKRRKHYIGVFGFCSGFKYQSIVFNLDYFSAKSSQNQRWMTWTVDNLNYLVVTTSNICTDGTHKRSDVIHKAVWEALAPRNTHVWGQE